MENGHGQVNVHLIGICGTAMATLDALLKRRGHHVRGSDEGVYPPMDAFLEREAIPVDRPTARIVVCGVVERTDQLAHLHRRERQLRAAPARPAKPVA